MRGYLDEGSPMAVRGWASDPSDSDGPVEVQIYLNEKLAATLRADLPRPDVAAAGVGGWPATFILFHPPPQRQICGRPRAKSSLSRSLDGSAPVPDQAPTPARQVSSWTNSKRYGRHLNARATGDAKNNWPEDVLSRHVLPMAREPSGRDLSCLVLRWPGSDAKVRVLEAGFAGHLIATAPTSRRRSMPGLWRAHATARLNTGWGRSRNSASPKNST